MGTEAQERNGFFVIQNVDYHLRAYFSPCEC